MSEAPYPEDASLAVDIREARSENLSPDISISGTGIVPADVGMLWNLRGRRAGSVVGGGVGVGSPGGAWKNLVEVVKVGVAARVAERRMWEVMRVERDIVGGSKGYIKLDISEW
jgi:hypothetical protein